MDEHMLAFYFVNGCRRTGNTQVPEKIVTEAQESFPWVGHIFIKIQL